MGWSLEERSGRSLIGKERLNFMLMAISGMGYLLMVYIINVLIQVHGISS